MKPRFRSALTILPLVIVLTGPVSAAPITKQTTGTDLNAGASWVDGTAPASTDVATWDTTSLGGALTIGSSIEWQGINVSGATADINITTSNTTNRLTIGSSGITLTGNRNLTLGANLGFNANQTWSVDGGRSLVLLAASRNADGSGDINILQTGTGVANIRMSQNGNNASWANFSGDITVNSNVKVQSEGNAAAAFGTGTITLAGGTIAQNNGSWTWGNNINITAASVIGNDSSNGLGRALKLLGDLTSSNSSGLTFTNSTTGGTRTDTIGFILAGANASTYTTTTISANSRVRVGGNDTATVASPGLNAGNRGSLGTGDVTLSATTSELAFTRTDAHTVANNITGLGTLVIGGNTTEMAGTSTQVVTLSGASDYTGSTRVSRSRLNLTGTLTSAITVDNSGSISGTGSTTGLLTLNSGSNIALAGGATTSSITANGATFGGSNLATFLSTPLAATEYVVFNYGAGTVTNIGNLTVAYRGTLSDDTTNERYVFTLGTAEARTWNTTSGTWAVNSGTNFSGGDQKFFHGDDVTFGDIASNSTVTLSGPIVPGSMTVNHAANAYTFTGTAIDGTGSLSKSGAGILTLSGANTYSGGTTLNAGTIRIGNNSALGTGSLALNGGTVSSDSGTLRTLENNLTVGGNMTFGDGTNGGQLVFNGTMDLQGSTREMTSVLGTQGARFNGVISNGGITKEGNGRITVANDTNTFTGATTINAGILATSLNALASSGAVTIGNVGSGGGLALGSNGTTTINNLSGVSGSVIRSDFNLVGDGARTLQINQTTGGEFAGSFTQGGNRPISLIKDGDATLTISGVATGYTGTTLVNAGTLLVTGSLGNSAVTVENGATFGGSGSIGSSLGLGAGSFFEVVDLIVPLNVTGTITFGSGFGIANLLGINWDSVDLDTYTLISTTQTFSASDIANFGFDNRVAVGTLGREAYFTSGSLNVVVIPEPRAALLGGLGLLILLRRRRP